MKLTDLDTSDSPNIKAMPLVELQAYTLLLQKENLRLEQYKKNKDFECLQLKEKNDILNDLFEYAPSAFLVVDQVGVITNLNIAAIQLFEIKKENLQGRFFVDYLHLSDKNRFNNLFEKLFENDDFDSRTINNLDIRIISQQSKVLHINLSIKVIEDFSNDALQCLICLRNASSDHENQKLQTRQNEELKLALADLQSKLHEKEKLITKYENPILNYQIVTDTSGKLLDIREDIAVRINVFQKNWYGVFFYEVLVPENTDFSVTEMQQKILSGTDFSYRSKINGRLQEVNISPIFEKGAPSEKMAVTIYESIDNENISDKLSLSRKNKDIVEKITGIFAQTENFAEEIKNILALSGVYAEAKRTFVVSYFIDKEQHRYTWEYGYEKRTKTTRQPILEIEKWEFLLKFFKRYGYLTPINKGQLSSELSEWLQKHDSLADIIFPLYEKEKLVGILGFDLLDKNSFAEESKQDTLLTIALLINSFYNTNCTKQLLSESEEKFQTIFHNNSDALFVIGFQKQFMEANQAAVKKLGYSREELKKMQATDIILNRYIEFFDTSSNFNNFSKKTINDYAVTKDGKIIPAEITTNIIHYKGIRAMLFIVRDLAVNKNVEIKTLQAVIDAEEREKERFAKDLHDGLGPLLSSVKIYLNILSRSRTEEERQTNITKTLEIIDDAISGIKEISNNISPHVLTNYGLVEAVHSFCKKLMAAKQIKINFHNNLLKERLPKHHEVLFFRVIEELIHNTIKHAAAENIEINITKNNDLISLIYLDDGRGFDMEEALKKNKTSMGLSNIFHRVATMKGTYRLNTAKGKGLKVFIEVDLAKANGLL